MTSLISHVSKLITKEHIAMHANLILLFKPALYSSTSLLLLLLLLLLATMTLNQVQSFWSNYPPG